MSDHTIAVPSDITVISGDTRVLLVARCHAFDEHNPIAVRHGLVRKIHARNTDTIVRASHDTQSLASELSITEHGGHIAITAELIPISPSRDLALLIEEEASNEVAITFRDATIETLDDGRPTVTTATGIDITFGPGAGRLATPVAEPPEPPPPAPIWQPDAAQLQRLAVARAIVAKARRDLDA